MSPGDQLPDHHGEHKHRPAEQGVAHGQPARTTGTSRTTYTTRTTHTRPKTDPPHPTLTQPPAAPASTETASARPTPTPR
ncbi:hypothetical protein GCM10018780_08830 [Streptomyces lanatus]|nr:hypothetical protein GCM10018780_08830 [Streptomyces lanatus]